MAHTENLAVHAPQGPSELTATVPKSGGAPAPKGRKLPKWLPHLGAHAILIAFSLFSLFPVWWVVAMALDPNSVSQPSELVLIPKGISLESFARVIAMPTEIDGLSFWQLMWNSVLLSVGTTLIGIVLGASAAYAFSRFNFPGRKAGLMSFLVLQMFPAVASIAPLYVLLSSLHIRTSLVGLAVAYAAGTLPFAIWNMKGYFDTVPK
ncbi:MAG: hypothetical protein ACK46X_09630, partial [Candidatus Sericytochromatia bacterium]